MQKQTRMTLFDAISIALAAFALHQVNELRKQTNARLQRLENQKPVKQELKAASVQAKQTWEKEIEGFNPETPRIILPRTKEEKKARVYTNWEIDSDFKIVG